MFKISVISTCRFIKLKCADLTHLIETTHHNKYGLGRYFHTSPQRFINPLGLLILRPVLKAISIISGRILRKRWKQMTIEKRNYYKKKYIFNRLLVIPLGVVIICGCAFYMTHLQPAPITNRSRFILFNEAQMTQLSGLKLKKELIKSKDSIIDPKSIIYTEVWSVVDRLIKSNMDIDKVKEQEWTLHVIDKDIENAFVLSNGHIFIYTGLLRKTENTDQLAFILGHEIAHVILSHEAENISFTGVINVIMAVVLLFIWAVVPDVLAVLVQSVQNKMSNVVLNLPYNRNLELEADKVGLELISKACFDVRESSILWKNWASDSELKDQENIPEILRTHPRHINRAKELDKLIPEAIERRLECKCPDLNESRTMNIKNVNKL